MKMQEMKMTNQIAGHENAGQDMTGRAAGSNTIN